MSLCSLQQVPGPSYRWMSAGSFASSHAFSLCPEMPIWFFGSQPMTDGHGYTGLVPWSPGGTLVGMTL